MAHHMHHANHLGHMGHTHHMNHMNHVNHAHHVNNTTTNQRPWSPTGGVPYSRRRSSAQLVWPITRRPSDPNPFYDPIVSQPPASDTYVTPKEWLTAVKAQTRFDFFMAIVVMGNLLQWITQLWEGIYGLPGPVNMMLIGFLFYGATFTFMFWCKKFIEMQGFLDRRVKVKWT